MTEQSSCEKSIDQGKYYKLIIQLMGGSHGLPDSVEIKYMYGSMIEGIFQSMHYYIKGSIDKKEFKISMEAVISDVFFDGFEIEYNEDKDYFEFLKMEY